MKSSLRFVVAALAFALPALLPGQASAWDEVTMGQVATMWTTYDKSGFQLVGLPSLCTSSNPTWAQFGVGYGDASDGVKTIIAYVTAAKLSGARIRVYANNGPDGTCHVEAVDLL